MAAEGENSFLIKERSMCNFEGSLSAKRYAKEAIIIPAANKANSLNLNVIMTYFRSRWLSGINENENEISDCKEKIEQKERGCKPTDDSR